MGESEESVFWSEKEEDRYGGIFTSEDYQSNHCFEPGSQIINDDEESGSKRIRLSPEFNQQEGDTDSSAQSSPLGLTLRKTPSFLSLVQRRLSKGKQADFSTQDNQSSHHDKPITKIDDLGSQSMSEKLKASNFPAIFIKIGAWQRITRHEGDLTAKLYYAKRKLVWEVLEGALKSKIEIQWSDIIAIRAITPDNEPGTLEIELNQPPLFYREINPQPRKHTLWQQASDFTGGQAPIWRRHYVRFPPGILDKHYEKLLQCDQRLFALSQKPFPSHESPYFDPTMFGISELSLSFNGYGSGYLPRVQYPYQTYPTTARGAPLRLIPNSTISVMDLPFINEEGSNNQFVTQTQTPWGQGANVPMGNVNNQGQSQITSATPGNQVFHSQNYQSNVGLLNDIENHLLGELQVVSSDDGTLCAKVGSMCSLLEPTDVNPNYNAIHSGTNYQITDSTTDQVMQNRRYINPILDGLYSEPVNWLPPQGSNDSIVMEQTVNNSLPPFMFPGNPSNGDFF
ncbi:hypothetical protein Pfo_002073 [Paulownia fortunei]|nr:hypothetical protein Pfo_002073 [Paulownia fortunei]